MSQHPFTLKYGKGILSFEIPAKQLLHELLGRNHPPEADLRTDYLNALDHLIDSAPLREVVRPGDTVVISVSDITRGWQRNADTLPFLLDHLNQAGVPDNKVTLIIVVGLTAKTLRRSSSSSVGRRSATAWAWSIMTPWMRPTRSFSDAPARDSGGGEPSCPGGRQAHFDRRGHLALHGRLRRRAQERDAGHLLQ